LVCIAALPLVAALGSSSVFGQDFVCPKGTVPRGETTPEVREAWCEVTVNGKTVEHGPYRSWWPNGRLGTKGTMVYGKAEGRWTGWYETGELQGEEWFKDGKIVKARYYDKEGRRISKPQS
jgi:hypothetical protein